MRNFAIIGLGRFGSAIARDLEDEGGEVVAIEKDPEKVRTYENEFTSVVEADSTDIDALRDLGISDVDAAVVSTGDNMGESILITLLLKEIGVPLIMVKAVDELHGKVLKKIGANNVVFPEKDSADVLSKRLLWPGYNELPLAPGLFMVEIKAPKKFIGKNLGTLKIRKEYDSNVIAVKRKKPVINEEDQTDYEETIIAPPQANTEIKEGDAMILVCSQDKIETFRELS
ncbi:MAG: TrkA family potassium uptake protein [Elusimicrobiota bacterium]|nr:TrkA family potassium uptake protein [Elusimicrobiota bacterium]